MSIQSNNNYIIEEINIYYILENIINLINQMNLKHDRIDKLIDLYIDLI